MGCVIERRDKDILTTVPVFQLIMHIRLLLVKVQARNFKQKGNQVLIALLAELRAVGAMGWGCCLEIRKLEEPAGTC